MFTMGSTVQEARADGYKVIVIPDRLLARVPKLRDINGNPILDIGGFIEAWNASFTYEFVDPATLGANERESWEILPRLVLLAGDHARRVKEGRITPSVSCAWTRVRTRPKGCGTRRTS